MSSNRLILNADKTEFIWLGTRQKLAIIIITPLRIGRQTINPVDKVRDLGVTIDNELTMDAHVANIVRSCFYQLRQLRSVRRSLTIDARHTLISAFIASRVDYCNAVLYGVCSKSHPTATGGAQRRRSPRRRHWQVWPYYAGSSQRSPLAASTSADWVQDCCSRIRLCLWYWPAYFKDVCMPVLDIAAWSSLRLAEHGDLFVPRTRTRTMKLSRRSFTVAAPVVCNSLPAHLRSPLISWGQFWAGLKTHLFKQAYSLWEHFVLRV